MQTPGSLHFFKCLIRFQIPAFTKNLALKGFPSTYRGASSAGYTLEPILHVETLKTEFLELICTGRDKALGILM